MNKCPKQVELDKSNNFEQCALEEGHTGLCIHSCGLVVTGRFVRLEHRGATSPLACVLPKNHEGLCEDSNGDDSCDTGDKYSIDDKFTNSFTFFSKDGRILYAEAHLNK